jgi:hypothetical protein
MWVHLVDQNGVHWIVSDNPYYFWSMADDGTQPIYLRYPSFGLGFTITSAQLTAIIGALPAAQVVVSDAVPN